MEKEKLLPLVSILVVSYNNQQFLPENLRSIFSQTYPNLEVLIGDDGSSQFDEPALVEWIQINRTQNIKRVAIFRSEDNMGTVANLDRLQKKSRGEFLLNIAADDVLYNEEVISSFYRKALEIGDSAEIIVAQTEMWDRELKNRLGDFILPQHIEKLQSATTRDLFVENWDRIFLPATYFYRKSVLEKVGDLCVQYRLVEDAPTHLRLLRQGVRPWYMEDVPSIRHRDGGISHGNSIHSKKVFLTYYQDLINIYVNEIEPYSELFTERQRRAMRQKYQDRVRAFYKIHIPEFERAQRAAAQPQSTSAQPQSAAVQPCRNPSVPKTDGLGMGRTPREKIKWLAYKLTETHFIFSSIVLTLLCWIAAGSLSSLTLPGCSFMSIAYVAAGCVLGVFSAGTVFVKVILLYRRSKWDE